MLTPVSFTPQVKPTAAFGRKTAPAQRSVPKDSFQDFLFNAEQRMLRAILPESRR